MLHIHSFPPLSSPAARVLILGSMPGNASLQVQRYYAHPQNLFWRMLGELVGFDPTSAYDARVAHLLEADIAVWDVLKTCVRQGNLDMHIEKQSIVPNDFVEFFAAHPRIERVCFNGTAAAKIFKRHIQPQLPHTLQLAYFPLPSTSPANASILRSDKARMWAEALLFGQDRRPV